MSNTLLKVENLSKYFYKTSGFFGRERVPIKAVDDVSLELKRKETFGLVGESGCGKSTTGRTILRLYEPTAGSIIYDGEELAHKSQKELFPYRRRMQMIFQDPYASLNPRMTVADALSEAMEIHGLHKGKDRHYRILELLDMVGLNENHASRYPHEFSGGQRQRIGIARALAVDPEFLVCDEPISALDVSIQAQIINMLEELQERLGLTYLFIAHDLSMVKHISHRVGVMYLGNLVEVGRKIDVYNNTSHPYTQALLSSIPIADPELSKEIQRIELQGEVPSPLSPPTGCRFHPRCPYVMPICLEERPRLIEVNEEHYVACHLMDKRSN